MLSRLFSIGQGVIILPFLDSEESRSVHVSKEISFLVQSFPFHPLHGVWRHKGVNYDCNDYGVVFLNGIQVGSYCSVTDCIIPFNIEDTYIYTDFFRSVPDIEVPITDVVYIDNGTPYLVDHSQGLWLFDTPETPPNGPYYPFQRDGELVIESKEDVHLNGIDETIAVRSKEESKLSPLALYHTLRTSSIPQTTPIPQQFLEQPYARQFLLFTRAFHRIYEQHDEETIETEITKIRERYLPVFTYQSYYMDYYIILIKAIYADLLEIDKYEMVWETGHEELETYLEGIFPGFI